MNKKYAILIDSDNISNKYIPYIFSELATIGTIPIRRLYGNFSKKDWSKECLEYSIKQVHQYNYTTGKNSTDSTMIIDAMDILYKEQYLDGFIIVSSDSDFTGLCQRIREANKEVIGVGERKTPKSVINSCSVFKYLENMMDEDLEVTTTKETKNKKQKTSERNSNLTQTSILTLEEISTLIKEIISQFDGSILVSRLKEIILQKHNDFDEKTYGYNQMRKFLESIDGLKIILEKDETTYRVTLNDNSKPNNKVNILAKIKDIINGEQDLRINLGTLQNRLLEQKINYKEQGFSRFAKYIESFQELTITKQTVTIRK